MSVNEINYANPTNHKSGREAMTTPTPIYDGDRISQLEDKIDQLTALIKGAQIIPAPRTVTITEAANVLGCHRSTIHRKINDNELEVVRVNGRRMVKLNPVA